MWSENQTETLSYVYGMGSTASTDYLQTFGQGMALGVWQSKLAVWVRLFVEPGGQLGAWVFRIWLELRLPYWLGFYVYGTAL
jgi:hypothetical protein